MSCGCNSTPCSCSGSTALPDASECPPPPTTFCNLYRPGMTNVWVEKGPNPEDINCPGICLLDTMSEAQIIWSIEHDEKARQDLLLVTTDPHLRELATTIPRLPVVEETDAEQALINRPNEPSGNPFYTIFRGQPPFAQ